MLRALFLLLVPPRTVLLQNRVLIELAYLKESIQMGNGGVAPESFLVRKTRRGVHIGIGALIGMRVLIEWGHLLTKIRGDCLLERGS